MSHLLHVDNISVSFDGFKAINSLSFDIGSSELRAIIGPNGAGKTTFMDIVTGKTRPDSGDVFWGPKSHSLLRKSEAEIAQLGIGRKFQKPTVPQALQMTPPEFADALQHPPQHVAPRSADALHMLCGCFPPGGAASETAVQKPQTSKTQMPAARPTLPRTSTQSKL